MRDEATGRPGPRPRPAGSRSGAHPTIGDATKPGADKGAGAGIYTPDPCGKTRGPRAARHRTRRDRHLRDACSGSIARGGAAVVGQSWRDTGAPCLCEPFAHLLPQGMRSTSGDHERLARRLCADGRRSPHSRCRHEAPVREVREMTCVGLPPGSDRVVPRKHHRPIEEDLRNGG